MSTSEIIVLAVVAFFVLIDVSFVAIRMHAARKADRRRARRAGMVRIQAASHIHVGRGARR